MKFTIEEVKYLKNALSCLKDDYAAAPDPIRQSVFKKLSDNVLEPKLNDFREKD